jgi:hypothetical protein
MHQNPARLQTNAGLQDHKYARIAGKIAASRLPMTRTDRRGLLQHCPCLVITR